MQGVAGDARPGQVTLYRGLCEGGPYHGRPLYHGLPLRKVARSKETFKVVSWIGDETDKIRIDEYRHDGDRWIWQELS